MTKVVHTPWRNKGPYIEGIDGDTIGQAFHLAGEDRAISAVHARLFAAAPELLAALKGMLDIWNTTCDCNGWERNHMQQQVDAVAAIKKSTGAK